MSLPYFPMYPTDFEAKTSHLTIAEDGAYNRLLRICWMTPGCTMPTDEAWIMRRVRAHTDEDKATVLSVLAEFFTIDGGRYSNAKLMRVWLSSNEAHKKRKTAGSKGGKAKALLTNNKTPSNAKAMLKQPEPEPEPIKNKQKAAAFLTPEFDKFWQSYPLCKRKTDKPKARVVFQNIVSGKHKQIPKTPPDKIIDGITDYANSMPDPEFIPLPTTWLNGERWGDTLQNLSPESQARIDRYKNIKAGAA